MRPTLQHLELQYNVLNKQCFQGQLPTVRIQLSKARTYLGQLGYKRRRKFLGGWEYYDYVIRISTRLDQTGEEVTDTLLHEMIHLYIAVNHLKDSSSHGPLFRQIMNEINSRYGRHITISHHRTKEELEQDTQQRMHLLCVSTFDTGERGITIAARSRIFELWDRMKRFPKVTATRWYVSNDPFFNRYPRSLTPKIYRISGSDLETHLKDAKPLIRQEGKIFVSRKMDK
ncbi:MAG: SprT-like domain-containing protein [Prevotella sp.]|nr:SprT-like domain-containing protein [Prevotella sp.]